MTLLELLRPSTEHSHSVSPSGEADRQPPATAPGRPAELVRRAAMVLAALAGLIGFGIFAVTPDGTGLVQSLDTRLSGMAHPVDWVSTTLSTALGSPGMIIAVALVGCLGLWGLGSFGRRSFRPLVMTAIAWMAAWLPAFVIRRPGPGHLGDLSAANATSFPSISAAMITALALATVTVLGSSKHPTARRAAVGFAIAAPIAVRLATASSWPLDELAGVLIGLLLSRCLGRSTSPRPASTARGRRTRHIGAAVVVTLGLAAIPVGWSFADILRAPGDAGLDQRSVEWLRDHGLAPLVDRGESWWLWRHLPSSTATITELPPPPVTVPITASAASQLPTPVTPTIQPPLPGEGTWTVASADSSGRPQIATTSFRPDPSHPSLVAGVAWINASTTQLTLIAGTRQPGGGAGASGGQVPDASLGSLLAAFNSGYKMSDTPGGTLMEGRKTRTMVDGLATLAIRPDGTATVGEWGADLSSSQGYVGLRQNLHLMVRHGAVVDGVATNAGGRWGTVRNTLPTWRSGIGVTPAGDLVYVGGDSLTLAVLAHALIAAGAVTAMELDIHSKMVTFNLFTRQPKLTGHRLLPNMTRSPNRYLATDWRDFVMVTSR